MSRPLVSGVFIGLALALPVAAQQSCPTAAELQRGIRIDFVDGSTETYRQQGSSTIVDGREPDGATYRLELAHGLYLVSYEALVDGAPDPATRVTYDYGMAPESLPVPAPLGRHRLSVKPTDSQATWDEAQSHAYGELGSVLIGGCTYDMFDAVILYDNGNFFTEGIAYLPTLGIGYLVWTESADEPRAPVAAIGIRAVTK